MTKGNKQNGRQPPVSQVSAPSSDLRCKNASTLSKDREKICRDFIWGICIKGARCAYRHERDLDHMKTVLKFCHDFQNKNGCVRPDCTYLHTTREEQNLFLNKGRIPKVLADRYAAMAAASTSESKVVKQLTINGESMPTQSDAGITVPGTAHQQPQTAAFPQLLLQPPPPPPPSTMVTATVQATVQNTSTTVIPQVPKQMLNQHTPQIPAIFDTSRPPPQLSQPVTGSQKRPAESIEAGPCKARKQEAPNVIETLCDNCVQRELRIEIIQDDNQKLQTQKDCKALLIDKNNEEFEHAKLLMKPLVKPELYQIMEEYLEKLPSDLVDPEALLEMNPTPSPMVMASSAKELVKHLFNRVIANGTNNVLDVQPTSNGISEDLNLSPLSTSARPKSDSVENPAVELIKSMLCIYKGSIDNTPDKSPLDKLISDPQPSTSSRSTSIISELTHYLNSQNEQSLQVTNGISTPPGVVSPSPSNLIENDSNTIIPFQPTVPPPVMRPMFPPPSAVSTVNIPNISIPNPMVLPPPTPTIRPSMPIVHSPTLTVPPPKPTTQPTVSVQANAFSVRQPSKPTPAIHSSSSKPMVPIQSSTLQMHPACTTMPSMLPVTPTEQTPKLTVRPVPTMQSLAITISPTTPARQSTPIQTPVSVQGPKIMQKASVVQSPIAVSPLASQQSGPAKRISSQNGKIFIPTNGRIPPRPHIFPPFQ